MERGAGLVSTEEIVNTVYHSRPAKTYIVALVYFGVTRSHHALPFGVLTGPERTVGDSITLRLQE
jgi:hypothetical protein